LDFPRGYHFEVGGGFNSPNMGTGSRAKGYGLPMKARIRQSYGTYFGLSLRGEMLPNDNCFMEIDENVNDKWGIPVVKFRWKWSEHELKQIAHGLKTAKKILETMGGRLLSPLLPAEQAIKKGGEIIHEVGTTRMGVSPGHSVTNQYGQTWDCENLFVMDGGVFASNPHKNCTLTLMTLAMRNASWLAKQMDKGAL
jgi:choline dehydrogenase-like flavoprotein